MLFDIGALKNIFHNNPHNRTASLAVVTVPARALLCC
jgi:hypothetical protein